MMDQAIQAQAAPMGYNPYYYGAQYVNQQRPSQNQALTVEEVEQLRTNGGAFDISLTQDELLRSFCTHKDPKTGAMTLIRNQDGSMTCSICQKTFNEELLTRENTEAIVKRFIDLLQTIKTAYTDIPVATARQFFSIQALASKVPNLADFAAQNMSRYQNAQMVSQGQIPYGFTTLNGVIGGAPAAYQNGWVNNYGVPAMNPPMQGTFNPYATYQQQMVYPQAPPQVPVTPNNEFGYYGVTPMAPPIVGPQAPVYNNMQAPPAAPQAQPQQANVNYQMPTVYPTAVGPNGEQIFMPGTQPMPTAPQAAPVQGQQVVQQQVPQQQVNAQPNTANVSMPMAQPVSDPTKANVNQPQQAAVRVDAANFSL